MATRVFPNCSIWGQHCTYRRVHFHSILEAWWAAYFDFLNLDWEYEPTTYLFTDNTRYTPDFYIPEIDLIVEIKGRHLDRIEKVGLFVKASKKSVLIGMEEGRFALVAYYNDEPENEEDISSLPQALLERDASYLDYVMKNYSSLATDENGNDIQFTNRGQSSDAYVGQGPDYFESMKDRTAPDGSDARSYYWGGASTWSQRGFRMPPNKVRRVYDK